jgi:cysteine desulfurase
LPRVGGAGVGGRATIAGVIYLDNNATTRPLAGVVEAVRAALDATWANPSSVHRGGQEARRVVELARRDAAELIGARPRSIVWTSGGTESIDLAIRGVLEALPAERRVVVTTPVEHAAVRGLAESLGRGGVARVERLAVDAWGRVVEASIERAIVPGVGLVSVQWANNETGVIQPIEAVSRRARAVGALVHVDGTQWVGKMPTDVGEFSGAGGGAEGGAGLMDLLSFAPHKFHGPKGVGVLWSGPGVRWKPRLVGVQEQDRRGGTENVPGIAGAGAAARAALEWLSDAGARAGLARLRDRFEAGVLARVPGAVVNAPPRGAGGAGDGRLWNTSSIAFPRLEAEALLLAMSERGLAASAGAACSSGSLEPSPVLLAMGMAPELAHGTVRFSLSRETTAEEIDRAIEIVAASVARVRGSMPG